MSIGEFNNFAKLLDEFNTSSLAAILTLESFTIHTANDTMLTCSACNIMTACIHTLWTLTDEIISVLEFIPATFRRCNYINVTNMYLQPTINEYFYGKAKDCLK